MLLNKGETSWTSLKTAGGVDSWCGHIPTSCQNHEWLPIGVIMLTRYLQATHEPKPGLSQNVELYSSNGLLVDSP